MTDGTNIVRFPTAPDMAAQWAVHEQWLRQWLAEQSDNEPEMVDLLCDRVKVTYLRHSRPMPGEFNDGVTLEALNIWAARMFDGLLKEISMREMHLSNAGRFMKMIHDRPDGLKILIEIGAVEPVADPVTTIQ